MILDIILLKKNGFYVDVGANNPLIQSNTHYFYKKGWKGINIDATPNSMKLFNKIRKRDINIEKPISDKHETLKYYLFSPSYYNTFEERFAELYKDKLVGEIELSTSTLSQIFEKYINNNEIDFLSVDVEGWDLKVLKSNDWLKYRPSVVVIEYITYYKSELEHRTKIKEFLESNGYILFCNSPTNGFFLENKFYYERFVNEKD